MSDVKTAPVDALHAWAEIPRVELPKRPVAERMADFLEIYTTLDADTARDEATRCVQCPHPSCVEACPLGNSIPDWLALTAEGHFLEAAQLLQSTTCMGDLFSRLCHETCESHCILDGPGTPVSINAVERFLQHYGAAHGVEDAPAMPPNGQRVAVMDAGPCGLACAHDLARRGYAVTVVDHHLVPGGLLINGVPAFKVEATIVEHRMRHLERMGVRFELGGAGDGGPGLAELRRRFDAVFFGACAEEARPLTVKGADLRGVFQGVTFLVQKSARLDLGFLPIEVAGRRVVVLGAGDTAMDCVRTALRSGAHEVVCVYRRDEPSLPAARHAYEDAVEEGGRFVFLADPVEVLGDAEGKVTGVRCARTRRTAGGRDPGGDWERVPGEEFVLPADVILVAFGYDAQPLAASGDLAAIERDAAGRIRVDADLMTSVPGVFAGGTLVRGLTQAVETVRDARRAAASIDRYLSARRTGTAG